LTSASSWSTLLAPISTEVTRGAQQPGQRHLGEGPPPVTGHRVQGPYRHVTGARYQPRSTDVPPCGSPPIRGKGLLSRDDDGVEVVVSTTTGGTFSGSSIACVDGIRVSFDDPHLVANAGLLLVTTLALRLELEALSTLWSPGRTGGGSRPGRKVMTVVHAIVAGGSHIDHVDVLRCGGTEKVLAFRVMAPSTVGSFLRAFTFGHEGTVISGMAAMSLPAIEVLGRTMTPAWTAPSKSTVSRQASRASRSKETWTKRKSAARFQPGRSQAGRHAGPETADIALVLVAEVTQ